MCAIYDKIDALDEARSVADLVRRLKPILYELAYHAVTGEGAVMDARESWHTTYRDRLYDAAGAERAAEQAIAAQHAPVPPAREPSGRRSKVGETAPLRRLLGSPKAGGSLPPALAAIMNGTHQSFREDDEGGL